MIRLRFAAISVLTAAMLTTSCGSLRRLGKDVFIVGTSPLIVLYGAATDGWGDSESFFKNYDPDNRKRMPLPQIGFADPLILLHHELPVDPVNWPLAILAFPVTFLLNAVKHTYYCARYAFDIVAFPAFGLAELHPNGPVVEPLDIYSGTIFDIDKRDDDKKDDR